MKLIVKVDPKRAKDPAKHVAKVLRAAASKRPKGLRVEEIFPGVREGSSAGLVSVEFNDEPGQEAHRAAVKALRDDTAVAYVNAPKSRRPL